MVIKIKVYQANVTLKDSMEEIDFSYIHVQ